MLYTALIGDVVQSRAVENRREVQRRFAAVCAELNTEGARLGLVAPFTVTLGDEFQAVFANAERLWECIFRMEAALAPVGIRFAIGVGEISTDIQRDTALGMDGPAFHHARAAMDVLKKQDTRYRVGGLGEEGDFINATLALIAYNRVKWRAPRVLTLASLLQGKTVKEICLLTHSSEQAVYRNIRDGALETVVTLLAGIARQLQQALAGSAARPGELPHA